MKVPMKDLLSLFNLLGRDSRNLRSENVSLSYGCDLQSSGYRIIKGKNEKNFLQVAVKLFNPVNNWKACTIKVEMDLDGDQNPDQMLQSFHAKDLPFLNQMNVSTDNMEFVTLIIDQKKYREIQQLSWFLPPQQILINSYQGVSRMQAFPYSTISIVEVPADKFENKGIENIHLKVSVTFRGIETSKQDFLSGGSNLWKKISLNPRQSGYRDIPPEVDLGPGESRTINITKGSNKRESLIIYFPRNFFTTGYGQDDQFVIPAQTFK